MKRRGWTVCMPEKTAEALKEKSRKLPNKTLFLLDYAEYDTTAIREWIKTLADRYPEKKHIRRRIRILLIQRRVNEGGTFEDDSIKAWRYKEPLSLKAISDEKQLNDMIRRFSRFYLRKHHLKVYESGKRKLTKEQAEEVIENLKKFDVRKRQDANGKEVKELLNRPLFAVILAVAKREGVPISSKKDALDYIYDHETKRYKKYLKDFYEHHFADSDSDIDKKIENLFNEFFMAIIVIATIARQWQLDNDGIKLLPSYLHYAVRQFVELYAPPADMVYMKNPNKEFELFHWASNSGITCRALEPDVVGGYFVLEWLRSRPSETRKMIVCSAWNRTRDVTQFVTRLFQDFEFEPWFSSGEDDNAEQGWFTRISLPSSLSVIP
jgi:hypothetical protein